MLETLQNIDKELDLIGLTRQDIIASIELEDVKNFLETLGVESIEMYPEKGYLVCPTICHNALHEEASMKLYWYQNNKIFRCYTECNEAMSIFKLYQKFVKLNYEQDISFYEAEEYVKKCLKHIVIQEKKKTSSWSLDLEKYKYTNNLPQLEEYPKQVLSYFSEYYHPQWLKEGITKETMKKFHIGFSIAQNKIVIPHFDIDNRLIGIRARALTEEEIKECGKYRPITIGDTIYSHPLQFNLYGIYEHKEGIKRRNSAIIAEAEKSVLLDDGYYGAFSNCVACCGSNFNKYHISLLTDKIGVNEIIIAFDKEYEDWRSPKAAQYRKKIEQMCKKYHNQASFSYIWDYDNVLNEKDSPFDRGKDIFEHLYKTRVKVR